MSYSISANGASKAEVKKALSAQLAEVAGRDVAHAADINQAEAAANSFIDVLPEDESKDIAVSVSGNISWSGQLCEHTITGSGVNIYAGFVPKAAA